MLRWPLAVLAVAYAAGIFIQRYFPVSQKALLILGACAFAAGFACVCLRRVSAGTAAVALLATALGALACEPFHDLPASVKQLEIWLHRPIVVEAAVKRVEPLSSGALRLTLRYDSIENEAERFLSTGLVQVTLQKISRTYHYGQRLRLGCRLRRPRNFNNPGGFDYERFLAHRGIYVTAFLSEDRGIIVLQEHGGHPVRRGLERYRGKLRCLICKYLGAPERDLVLALLLGEKQTLCPELKKQFARLGVAHLLAISGLHIGIVAALAFTLACFLLRRFPRLFLYVVLWKAAALISLVPLAVYCCVAGLQIPTLRAGIMIASCAVCVMLNRTQDICNALALACLVILVWMPAALFEISFQLSFGAVFFLIMYAPHVQKLIAVIERREYRSTHHAALVLFRVLTGILAASIIATAATVPITAYYFHQVSSAGILANCVLVPAIGFGAVPCCLVAALLVPVSEIAAAGFLQAAGLILEQAVVWIRFWSDMRIVSMQVVPPSTVAMCAWYAGMLGLAGLLRTRRTGAAALLCTAVAVLWLYAAPERGNGLLCVTFLDVGHGDAAVVRFPQGRVMLIDSGGLRSDRFDTGASIVAPALRAMGIRTVTWLVITHPHHDHMAGMGSVMEAFHPQELWVPQEDYPDPLFRLLIRKAHRQGLSVRTPGYGAPALNIDGAVVEFLSPDARQAGGAGGYHDLNDSSLVIRISYGAHAFLFAGDIEARQEQLLLERPGGLRAQVLKVPHHGKRSSSTAAFLNAVAAESAVFSCRPSAGHDLSAEILRRYRERSVQVLRTDLHGAIQISSNGARLENYTFLPRRKFTLCAALPQPGRRCP